MAGGCTHVARMFRGCPRSLPVQGVSVPSPGRARPGARAGPRDGDSRRSSARRRIALREGWRSPERPYEGDADRGEDCVARSHVLFLFTDGDGAKPPDSLYTPIVWPGALTLKLGHPHLHRTWRTIGP